MSELADLKLTYDNVDLMTARSKLQSLTIINSVNDHTSIHFKYLITQTEINHYIHKNAEEIQIEAAFYGKFMFIGIVTQIAVKASGNDYYLEVDGKSYTVQLDLVCEQICTYQGVKSIEDIIQKKLGGKVVITGKGAPLPGEMMLQYNETDWRFFKRLGSVLIADQLDQNKPGIKLFQTEEEAQRAKNLHSLQELDPNYSIKSKAPDCRSIENTDIPGLYYEAVLKEKIAKDKVYDIGTSILNGRENLYIRRSIIQYEQGAFTLTYILTPSIEQNIIPNHEIAGISLEGTILEVHGEAAKDQSTSSGISAPLVQDQVQVKLDSDQGFKEEEAVWFPFATVHTAESSSGLYCMPEKNERVKLYFPSEYEGDAFVMTAVRSGGNDSDLPDPGVKCFRTNFGKEIRFDDKEIVLTVYEYKDNKVTETKKAWLSLNQDKGIEIHSVDTPIQIVAEKDLYLNSTKGNIKLSAANELQIVCKESHIVLNKKIEQASKQGQLN